MRRRPPRSTRTDTLFPYTTLFRSEALLGITDVLPVVIVVRTHENSPSPVDRGIREVYHLAAREAMRRGELDSLAQGLDLDSLHAAISPCRYRRNLKRWYLRLDFGCGFHAARSEERRVGQEWVRR